MFQRQEGRMAKFLFFFHRPEGARPSLAGNDLIVDGLDKGGFGIVDSFTAKIISLYK